MIQRKTIESLQQWKEEKDRKPLILRGARQVGKTTLVVEFAKQFTIFLHLNLEKTADRNLFEQYDEVNDLIKAIFFHKREATTSGSVLLFIDEIQYSKKAVAMLRYFYEEAGHIYVIAAGSLLETVMDVRTISFPVGRVAYLPVRPCSFLEFLNGIGNDFDAELVRNLDASPVHDRIIKQFKEYALVGGMPAVVSKYAENRNILSLKRIYNSLLQSYRDDVERYTKNINTIRVIREILEAGWLSAGSIITFEKFGGTRFSSKEMSLAFQTIQKAMLLELVFPTSSTLMPLIPNYRQHPKLIWFDTGLVNYAADIQQNLFSVKDIHQVWRGRIAEQVVAQELLTIDDNLSSKPIFWKRNKHGSEAEVDFLYKFNGLAIPIEVKSGHNSTLKSLHLYMDETPHEVAVRVWSNPFSVDSISTPKGKEFLLINLPFYYVGVLDKVLAKIFV